MERALANTRVVGHSLYWQLKANMYACESYERFYLILERFLMCCGQYKNELLKQHKVNSQLVEISTLVERKLDVEKVSKRDTIELMHKELCKAEVRIKIWQQLVI